LPSLDIGIDLGTSTILVSDSKREKIIKEPSVVAVRKRTGEILGIGADVYRMLGRTPDTIQVVRPLEDGVISDFRTTEILIKHLLHKINYNQLVKPRICVCVPSGITGVESNAVINAAAAAGARKVYLIEEPVAAAIGAGVDLSKPAGNLVVDIGGGTCDIAVLSFNGIVCKTSLRVAGNKFDEAIVKYMRTNYNLLIGEKTAENIKIELGSVYPGGEEVEGYAKGRDLVTGLPKQVLLRRSELIEPLLDIATVIIREIQSLLEKTPPELAGDIRENGIVMTGGGAMLDGLDELITRNTRARAYVAENAVESVAIGTARSFAYLDKLYDGFAHIAPPAHQQER